MNSISTLVAQLGPSWRAILVSDQAEWKRPAWMIQRLDDDGAWRGVAVTRVRHQLHDLARVYAGKVSADAAKILDGLPARVDPVRGPLK
jgi:hypothetical protein